MSIYEHEAAEIERLEQELDQKRRMQTMREEANAAGETMSVQELFDLLTGHAEEDSGSAWDKVHAVLPWLLHTAWAFYEDYDATDFQSGIAIAGGVVDPDFLGQDETAKDVMQNMSYLCHHMREDWKNLTPATRAHLEQIEKMIDEVCPR